MESKAFELPSITVVNFIITLEDLLSKLNLKEKGEKKERKEERKKNLKNIT